MRLSLLAGCRVAGLPPHSSKVTTTSVPLRRFPGEGFIKKPLHPCARDLGVGVVAVVIHVGSVEGIRDQAPVRVLDKVVVGLHRVDGNHMIAPFFLHLAEGTWRRTQLRRLSAMCRPEIFRGQVPEGVLRHALEIDARRDQAVGDCPVGGGAAKIRSRQSSPGSSDMTDETARENW